MLSQPFHFDVKSILQDTTFQALMFDLDMAIPFWRDVRNQVPKMYDEFVDLIKEEIHY